MAGISYGDAGTNRNITNLYYGDAGTNRKLKAVYYGDAGTNRKVWPAALAVSVPNKTGSTPHTSISFTTTAAVPTVMGGVPDFTYSWTYVSGDSFTINSPTGSTTTFSQGLDSAGTYIGTYRCAVTDYAGISTNSTFTVTITRT